MTTTQNARHKAAKDTTNPVANAFAEYLDTLTNHHETFTSSLKGSRARAQRVSAELLAKLDREDLSPYALSSELGLYAHQTDVSAANAIAQSALTSVATLQSATQAALGLKASQFELEAVHAQINA